MRDQVASGDGQQRGANLVATPRSGTWARAAESAAAAYRLPATTRQIVSSAAVSTAGRRAEDCTKVYHQVSPEKPS